MRAAAFIRFVIVCLACCGPGPAYARQSDDARREIGHLLDHVAHSQCQFNRNGKWYSGDAARAHLQQKYDYLLKRNLVPDAEAFIARAASASSMSGKPYLIRCGATTAPSGPWLSAELKRYRTSVSAKPAGS